MKSLRNLACLLFFAFAIGAWGVCDAGAASNNYDAQVNALYAKQAALDAEMAKPAPNAGKIERLSKEIGELQGKILAADAQRMPSQRPPQNYYQDDQRYSSGYGHRGYGHRSGYGHHGGHGCW